MTGAQPGRANDEDAVGNGGRDRPAALRIDTGVFVALTEPTADDEEPPVIDRWLDCWRS